MLFTLSLILTGLLNIPGTAADGDLNINDLDYYARILILGIFSTNLVSCEKTEDVSDDTGSLRESLHYFIPILLK